MEIDECMLVGIHPHVIEYPASVLISMEEKAQGLIGMLAVGI